MVLRRPVFKHRHGLTLDYDIGKLLDKSVRYADLPLEARAAWAHKRTTESAQVSLPMVALA